MAPDRPLEPSCIPITEAAAYCGLTLSAFGYWVAIDRLSGLPASGTPEPEENDLDRVPK